MHTAVLVGAVLYIFVSFQVLVHAIFIYNEKASTSLSDLGFVVFHLLFKLRGKGDATIKVKLLVMIFN